MTSLRTPVVELALFGAPQLRIDGFAVAPGARKALALLAYLALEGRSTRGKLAALFWPDLDGASARRNLRRELHRLRTVGADVALDGGDDSLALAPTVTVDTVAFDQALRAGDLGRAVALYRGALLDGFELGDGGDFEPWLAGRREALALRHRDAVSTLAGRHEQAGRWRDALAAYLRLIDLDTLQELHFVAAMRMHARLGEREAALALFERCRQLLGRELGLRPMPQTLALAESIRTGSFALGEGTGAAPPAAEGSAPSVLPPRLPLVGREALAAAIVERLRAGRGVWLLGEPGIGKSRLADEVAARLGRHWTVAASPGDPVLPYATVTRALRRHLDGDTARGLPDWARGALAHLLPEFGGARGRLDSEADRQRLHAAAALALRRAMPPDLRVIVLDDWHAADPASRACWQQALASAGVPRPVPLFTARAGEMDAALRDAVALAQRSGSWDVFTLTPLDAAAILELVRALSGGRAGERFAAHLHQATGGNPFFLHETLQHLGRSGLLYRHRGGGWETGFDVTGGDRHELPLPPSVRDAVMARLSTLDEATRRLLEAASLVGTGFMAEDLAGTTALAAFELVAAVERACAQLVLVRDEPAGTLRFGHDLLAQTLADSLSPERRRLLHRRLAAASERRSGVPSRIARHLEQAGLRARALRWRLAAAAAAEALAAYDQALVEYDAALADAEGPAERHGIRLRRARLLQRASRPQDADAEFEAAERAALDAGDGAGVVAAMLAKAEHLACSSRVDAAIGLVDSLLDDGLLTALQQVEALEIRADCLLRRGALEQAQGVMRDALQRLPGGPTPLRGRVLTALGRVAMYRGDFDGACVWLDKAMRVHAVTGALEALAKATFMRGAAEMNCRRYDRAVELLERSREQAARAGSVPVQRGAILNLVKVHTQRGEVARALAALDAGEALSPLYESLEAEGAFLQSRYYCHVLVGELERALALLPRVLENAGACTDVYWQVGAGQLVADLLLLLGDLDRAADVLGQARAKCGQGRDEHHLALVEAKLAWLDLARGAPVKALQRLLALGALEAMTLPEAVDVRRHVEAAARLVLGDAAGALAVVPDPGGSSTEESKALQWAMRVEAEAALGTLQPATREAVATVLADDGRLPALEALVLRRAWARALAAGADPQATSAAALAEDSREALRDRLAEDAERRRCFDALYPPLGGTATPTSMGARVVPT